MLEYFIKMFAFIRIAAPDKQARLFGGQDLQVTFQALKERRTNVLERRSSGAERKKSNMETLKGPILPMNNGGTPNNGTLASGASRNRGKAPKPKVTSIDFANGNHGLGQGAMNQVRQCLPNHFLLPFNAFYQATFSLLTGLLT